MLTLLMPGFSSSEKHESSITESGEAVIGRLGCSENRRGEPLDSVRSGYNKLLLMEEDCHIGLQVANKPYCSINC